MPLPVITSDTHATPLVVGSAAVLVAYPAGTELVLIGTVTVPGAIAPAEVGTVCAVCKNTLSGKFVPVKFAAGCDPSAPDPLITVPPVITLAGFLSIRYRPSPCVPGLCVAATCKDVDPAVHPVEHVPWYTFVSSDTIRS